MVPICSWKEGEVAFLTFLLIETQVVVWSPVYFLLLAFLLLVQLMSCCTLHTQPCPSPVLHC